MSQTGGTLLNKTALRSDLEQPHNLYCKHAAYVSLPSTA